MFSLHAHGCASAPTGANANEAHNELRDECGEEAKALGVHCQHEPRRFQRYFCTACLEEIEGGNGAEVERKVRVHDKNCRSKLLRSGMDSRYVIRGERKYIDFTLAHVTCASRCRMPISTIISEKISEKVVKYGKSVPDGELVVALATSSGYIHEDFVRLLGWMAKGVGDVVGPLVDRVRAKVIGVQGASIHAAWSAVERRSGMGA